MNERQLLLHALHASHALIYTRLGTLEALLCSGRGFLCLCQPFAYASFALL
jgi:hypothetical protein